MTLVIAAYNKDSIVVAADSLRGIYKDRSFTEKELRTDAIKLYLGGSDWAILLAGNKFDSGRVDQFLKDFTYDMKDRDVHDFDIIVAELYRRSVSTIPVEDTLDIQFILAGFHESKPKLSILFSQKAFVINKSIKPYLAAGQPVFAFEKLDKLDTEGMGTKELRYTIRAVIEEAKKELVGIVGGSITVKTLRP